MAISNKKAVEAAEVNMAWKLVYCPIIAGTIVSTEELKQYLADGWAIGGYRSDPFGMMAGVSIYREEEEDG